MDMALGSPPTGKEGERRKGDRGMVARLKKKEKNKKHKCLCHVTLHIPSRKPENGHRMSCSEAPSSCPSLGSLLVLSYEVWFGLITGMNYSGKFLF